MTSLESPKESLNNNSGLMSLEIESSRLKNKVKLSALKTETLKGKFRLVRNNGDYKIYSYILEKGGLPAAVRAKAVRENLATSQEKKDILITDIDGNKYNESTNFRGGKKVYVKIPTKKSKVDPKKAEIKPQQNKPKEVSDKKVENKQKTEIQQLKQPKIGVFEYKNPSSNGEYEIYSYHVGSNSKTFWSILNEAGKQIKLKTVSGIKTTNSNGKRILGPFKNEKIYIWVPKYDIENDVQIIDGMKRKGGEYFGIDISHWNEEIDLESFKKRNSEKWKTKKSDTRGVSFIYVRASDGVTKDRKLESHINKIKLYNNDPSIEANHEKIAVGFYHRMDYHSAEKNADTFIKNYNDNKDKHGGNNLIPMLDLEADWNNSEHKVGKKRPKLSKEEAQEKTKKCLEIIEKNTGIIPGIYTTVSIYNNYFLNDNRFNKYKKRIAAYPPSYKQGQGPNGGREIANGPSRINHKTGAVNLGIKNIYPEMYQSSQEGSVDGAYAIIIENKRTKYEKKYHDTDMDHTKDITKLFSKNNKSK